MVKQLMDSCSMNGLKPSIVVDINVCIGDYAMTVERMVNWLMGFQQAL